MYLTIWRNVENGLVIILVLVRRKSIHYDEDMCENQFCMFVSSDLDLSILDLNFAPFLTVALVQGHVSKKWEISMAFLFQEKWWHGTDKWTDIRIKHNV